MHWKPGARGNKLYLPSSCLLFRPLFSLFPTTHSFSHQEPAKEKTQGDQNKYPRKEPIVPKQAGRVVQWYSKYLGYVRLWIPSPTPTPSLRFCFLSVWGWDLRLVSPWLFKAFHFSSAQLGRD